MLISRTLLLSATLAFPLLLSSAHANDAANRFYEDALSRQAQQDYDGALIQLKNALKEDRNNLPARIMLGRLYLREGRGELAEIELAKATALGADEELILVPLGYALLLQGKHDELMRRLTPGERSQDVEGEIQLIRGKSFFDRSELEQADQSFKRATELLPEQSSPALGVISVMLARNQLEQASEKFAEARKHWPDELEISLKQAQYYRLRGELTRARAELAPVLEKDPENLEARRLRAAILIDLKQPELAIQDLTKLREKAPSDPHAIFLYALALAESGEHKQASDLLHESSFQLSRVAPEFIREHPQTRLSMGIIHYLMNRYDDARPFLLGYLDDHPNHLGVRKLLADIAEEAQQSDEVVRLLTPAVRDRYADPQTLIQLARAHLLLQQPEHTIALLELLPESSLQRRDVVRMLATAYLLKGEVDSALELVKLSLDDVKDEYSAHMALGYLQLRSGQLASAEQTADKLVILGPERPGTHNFRGAVLLHAKHYQAAEQAFQKALELDPGYQTATMNLAKTAFDSGDIALAEQRYRAIHDAKDSVGAGVMLAKIMLIQKRYQEAVRYLEKVTGKPGVDIASEYQLVALYLSQKQPQKALDLISRLERKTPGSMSLVEARAKAYMQMENPQAARSAIGVLYGMVLDSPNMLKQVAEMQLSIGDLEGAENTAGRLRKLLPEAMDAQLVEIRIAIARQDFDAAQAKVEALQRDVPHNGDLYRLAGDVYAMQGKWEHAEGLYRRAAKLAPNSYVIGQLFKIAWNNGRKDQAVKQLGQWVGEHPADHSSGKMLASAYIQLEQPQLARQQYQKMLDSGIEDAQVLNNMALLSYPQNADEALDYARRAHQLAPQSASVLDTLGWLLAQTGQPEQGLAYLRQANARAARNPQLIYHLGATLHMLQRNQEAKLMLEKALTEKGHFAERQLAEELLAQLREQS